MQVRRKTIVHFPNKFPLYLKKYAHKHIVVKALNIKALNKNAYCSTKLDDVTTKPHQPVSSQQISSGGCALKN